MALAIRDDISLVHSTFHFPQLGDDNTCGKRIRQRGEGNEVRCGQDRDGSRHLFYPCPVDDGCPKRFYSIDMRDYHVEISHGR